MNNQITKNIIKKIKKLYEKYADDLKSLTIIAIIVAIVLWFSTYTNNITLTCSRQNNLCTITQINLYGHKKSKSFELSSIVRAEHHIQSSNSYKRTAAAISRPFSADHEFAIIQNNNNSIKVYSVTSSGKHNIAEITDINNNVLEFNNFLDNNEAEQINIEKF